MKKKLTCHCGGVEAEVNIPETGIEKLMRCNCTLCKRKGYIIGVLGENDFTLTKGKELLALDQSHQQAKDMIWSAGSQSEHLMKAIATTLQQLSLIHISEPTRP